MGVSLKFNDDLSHCTYWSEMAEICPSNNNAIYLKKIPYSSCAEDDNTNNTNFLFNIYVFSDKYSNKLQFLDDQG